MISFQDIFVRGERVRDAIALYTGAYGQKWPAVVDGYGSEFKIPTTTDLWRVQTLAGEKEIISRLLASVEHDSVLWDVGANIGTHACICASKCDLTIAFEPASKTRDRLIDNANLASGEVIVRPEALSDKNGESKLTSEGQAAKGTHRLNDRGDLSVKTIRGDDLVGELPSPDVLKIDVEGHEIAVLDGLKETMTDLDVVFVEVHKGVPTSEITSRLEAAGLEVESEGDRGSEHHIIARRSK